MHIAGEAALTEHAPCTLSAPHPQSLLDSTKGFNVMGPSVTLDQFAVAAGRAFGFAYVWGIGGNLVAAARADFSDFVREQLAPALSFPSACKEGGNSCGLCVSVLLRPQA